MKFYYDLHIHSVLSPCADSLMTPNNIINMASLKGLHLISITDHNSLKQLPIVDEIVKSYELILIYGVEVELQDQSHVLCYFKTLEDAMKLDDFIEHHLEKRTYNVVRDGEQVLTNIYDLEEEQVPYYLGCSTLLTLTELINELDKYPHLRFLAHVDRTKNSGIKMHPLNQFDGIECTKHIDKHWEEELQTQVPYILHNSDAHTLVDISEREESNWIELSELSITAFFNYFHHG